MGCGASSEPRSPQRSMSIERMHAKREAEELATGNVGDGHMNDVVGGDLLDNSDDAMMQRPTSPSASKSVRASKLFKAGHRHDLEVLLRDEPGHSEEKQRVIGRIYERIDTHGNGMLNMRWLQDVFKSLGLRSSTQHLRGLFEMQTIGGGDVGDCDEFANSGNGFPSTLDVAISSQQFIDIMCSTPASQLLDKLTTDPEDETVLEDDDATSYGSYREPVTRHWAPGTRPFSNYTLKPFAALPRRVKCLSSRMPVVVTCCKGDSTLQLIDIGSKEIKRSFQGHCDSVFDLCISPNKQYVATVSRDTTLIIWETTCGVLVKQYSHPGAATAVIFMSNSEVLTGCSDSRIRRYNIQKGLTILDSGRQAPRDNILGPRPVVVALAKCGKLIAATRLSETSVELFDMNLRRVMMLGGHSTLVWMLDTRQDGTHLLSVCEKQVQVWNTGYLQKRENRVRKDMGIAPGKDASAQLRVSGIPLEGLERFDYHPEARTPDDPNRVFCWQAARWLPGTLDHCIIASSSDHAVCVLNMQGVQLLLLYQRYPIYCISTAVENEDGPVYLGDVAGNILTFTPS